MDFWFESYDQLKWVPKRRMHFLIIPKHLCVKTLTLQMYFKILLDQIIVIFDIFHYASFGIKISR